MENAPSPESEKQRRWNEALEALNHIDVGNTPLDENIRETLVGLHVLDIPTTASCGGHLEDLEVSDSDRGPFLFVQNVEDRPDDDGKTVEQELVDKWIKGQEILLRKVRSLLEEFNSNRPENKYRLYLRDIGQPGYRIESGAEKEWDAMQAKGETASQMDSRIRELTIGAQTEFAAFTEFVRQKYFVGQ